MDMKDNMNMNMSGMKNNSGGMNMGKDMDMNMDMGMMKVYIQYSCFLYEFLHDISKLMTHM